MPVRLSSDSLSLKISCQAHKGPVCKEGKEANCNNSKRNKHVLRLALSMHVLYDHLRTAINLETGVTSHKIALETLNMAIALVQSLEIYKGISHTVSSKILHMYLYD